MTQPWIWITGTSSGLGLGLARACLSRTQVLGMSRRPTTIEEANYHHLFLDLRESDRIRPTLEGFVRNASPKGETMQVDLLVLNAGVLGPIEDLHRTRLDDVKMVMDTNLWANKSLIDVCLDLEAEGLISGPRRILAISSGASITGQRGWNAYSISKAGLNMMIKLYAAERPDHQWIALAPGLVHTPMQDALAAGADPATFPAVKRMLAARGTPDMPPPADAARNIIARLDQIFDRENGSYIDIRKM